MLISNLQLQHVKDLAQKLPNFEGQLVSSHDLMRHSECSWAAGREHLTGSVEQMMLMR